MKVEEKINELALKYSRQYHHNTFDGKNNEDFVYSQEEIKQALNEFSKWNTNYKDAFDYDEDWLNILWTTLYGNEPVADTGNYFNCTPEIVNRIIDDNDKLQKTISNKNKFIFILLGIIIAINFCIFFI